MRPVAQQDDYTLNLNERTILREHEDYQTASSEVRDETEVQVRMILIVLCRSTYNII